MCVDMSEAVMDERCLLLRLNRPAVGAAATAAGCCLDVVDVLTGLTGDGLCLNASMIKLRDC